MEKPVIIGILEQLMPKLMPIESADQQIRPTAHQQQSTFNPTACIPHIGQRIIGSRPAPPRGGPAGNRDEVTIKKLPM